VITLLRLVTAVPRIRRASRKLRACTAAANGVRYGLVLPCAKPRLEES
jgi:hypothetical protein